MLPSEVPRLSTDPPVRVFPGVWKLLSFVKLSSQEGSPSLPLLALFLSFIFFPTSFRRQWAAFLGAWYLLPAFRSCFVEFTPCSNVLSMNLWGRKCSPCSSPQPSSEYFSCGQASSRTLQGRAFSEAQPQLNKATTCPLSLTSAIQLVLASAHASEGQQTGSMSRI